MDLLNRIIDWLKSNVAESKPAKYAFYFYCGVIVTGASYGAFRGFLSWVKWRESRVPTRITYKTIEPIVNNSIDAGRLGLYVLMSGLISGAVVATSPISVPIIVWTMKEKDEKDKKKDSEVHRSESLPAIES